MDYLKLKSDLAAKPKDKLENEILNAHYNDFLSANSSIRKGEPDERGHGKRIPYIGWFWRRVDFATLSISIGDCGSFVGFMENNKWDYPERNLTEAEAMKAIAIIDEAIKADRAGGCLADIVANTDAKLEELWAFFQTLEVPREDATGYGESDPSLENLIRAVTP